jgi:ABC-2 type transport system ATP-binding protein
VWAAVFGLGLTPKRWVTLEVVGRHSGRVVRFPLGMADCNGEWYVVPMLGERCNWAQNVRAANERATLRHRRAVECQLVEVAVTERPPILKRYLDKVPGARPHVPVDRHAPVAVFALSRCSESSRPTARGSQPAHANNGSVITRRRSTIVVEPSLRQGFAPRLQNVPTATRETEFFMGAPAIRTEGLSKRYGDVDALRGLDLEIDEGEVVGYLGPNGAGKTTTIRLLLGLARPTSGRAEIFGLDCQRGMVEAHRRLAYVPGEANLWPSLTGAETLHLLGRVQGRVDVAYRDVLIGRFDLDPSKKVRAYSKGNRQKVLLIAALMARPDLLLLDEPTSGLDPLMEQAFRQSVQEARDAGQTVFLSSHILSEVEALCDRVGILREGRLVEMGTLGEMRHLSAVTVEAIFNATPPDLAGVPGVKRVVVEGRHVHLEVQGPIEPLVDALAGTGVRELLSREPSLEELFLAHYGADGAAPVRAATGEGEVR